MAMPAPRWARHAMAAIAAAGALVALYWQLNPTALVSAKAANARLELEVSEYGKHIADPPVSSTVSLDGRLTVQVYADGCVGIVRRVESRVLSRLVLDLARGAAPEPSHAERALLPVVYAQSRCLDYHPGVFVARYGDRHGEWVDVIREWPDGCWHLQPFHPPSGTWGQVVWKRCVH